MRCCFSECEKTNLQCVVEGSEGNVLVNCLTKWCLEGVAEGADEV